MAKSTELTNAQVARVGFISGDGDAKLRQPTGAGTWARKVRQMRRDPTVSLVRRLIIAPALAVDLSFESNLDAPEGAVDLIRAQIEPLRIHIIDNSFRGCIDFGWQPFELVFDVDENGNLVIRKMKPLLQDFTEILVDEQTGAYAGLLQGPEHDRGAVTLEPENTFVHNWDVEGTDWYGEALMRAVEGPYDESLQVREANNRYDAKIAGSHWVIKYPQGVSRTVEGVDKDNGEIAVDLLNALKSSGSIAIPNSIDPTALLTDQIAPGYTTGWSIELMSDGGAASTGFIARQQYLDALKARAFGVPERAVLEGQFGTKAEAEAHGDMAVVIVGMRNEMLWQSVNWHIVNRLLVFNYGPEAEGTVWVKPAPLSELQRAYFKTIYDKILSNPDGFAIETAEIDMQALRETIGVPTIENVPDLLQIGEQQNGGNTVLPNSVLAQVS